MREITPFLWEIPPVKSLGMRVPARIYASRTLLSAMDQDQTLRQLANVASLPGIVKYALAMPDAHQGFGFPIGGVAATLYPDGAISPGGIGYDINCGVRLMSSSLSVEDVRPRLHKLSSSLLRAVPTGMGRHKGGVVLTNQNMEAVLREGARWAVENGYGVDSDLDCIESNGALPSADPGTISEQAKQRGQDQLGTLGSGNHFVEVGYVQEIYHAEAAQRFGLKKGQVTVLIHTGSRGLGHQTATDHIRKIRTAMPRYGFQVSDSQLACVPLSSKEGQAYFAAMCAAANFAFANRQCITGRVRKVWETMFGESAGLSLVYDVAHNIAKVESHILDGRTGVTLLVHRKGATRAFGPGQAEVPKQYRACGQPVLIPGSMGTSSYVLVGTGMNDTWASCCHGAGRRMSREAAKREFRGRDVKKTLGERGTVVETSDLGELAEEAPRAYKDVDSVVDVVAKAGIATKVAKLKPLGVIK